MRVCAIWLGILIVACSGAPKKVTYADHHATRSRGNPRRVNQELKWRRTAREIGFRVLTPKRLEPASNGFYLAGEVFGPSRWDQTSRREQYRDVVVMAFSEERELRWVHRLERFGQDSLIDIQLAVDQLFILERSESYSNGRIGSRTTLHAFGLTGSEAWGAVVGDGQLCEGRDIATTADAVYVTAKLGAGAILEARKMSGSLLWSARLAMVDPAGMAVDASNGVGVVVGMAVTGAAVNSAPIEGSGYRLVAVAFRLVDGSVEWIRSFPVGGTLLVGDHLIATSKSLVISCILSGDFDGRRLVGSSAGTAALIALSADSGDFLWSSTLKYDGYPDATRLAEFPHGFIVSVSGDDALGRRSSGVLEVSKNGDVVSEQSIDGRIRDIAILRSGGILIGGGLGPGHQGAIEERAHTPKRCCRD
jgi:hypothetical protein